MIRPTAGQPVHDTRNGRLGTLVLVANPESPLVRVAWSNGFEGTASLEHLAYGYPEGETLDEQRRRLVG